MAEIAAQDRAAAMARLQRQQQVARSSRTVRARQERSRLSESRWLRRS
jgi:hypothetical protein